MKDIRTIDRKTYLTALGLFTLASSHYNKEVEALAEIKAILGTDTDHIADELWGRDQDFDAALKREGISVSDEGARSEEGHAVDHG